MPVKESMTQVEVTVPEGSTVVEELSKGMGRPMRELSKEWQFVAYYRFLRWTQIGLGLEFQFSGRNGVNLTVALPFGWFRIGWSVRTSGIYSEAIDAPERRQRFVQYCDVGYVQRYFHSGWRFFSGTAR